MIGKLTGRIDYRGDDHVLLDVGGVGYMVYCSARTLAGLPGAGEVVALYTDLIVREDLLQLYGFPSLVEKEWHRLLLTVQGVGAKAALAIQGALGPDGVSRAIAMGDWNAIKAARGIGPKTAQRVVNELKEKAPALMAMGPARPAQIGASVTVTETVADPSQSRVPPAPEPNNAQAEALSALDHLGYGPGEAAGAVAQASGDNPDADTAGLIRAALRLLAPQR